MEADMASDQTVTATQFFVKPLYLQVRDAIIERIGKGEWKPGTAIPNEVDLAREFGISSGTMRKALDLLEVERAVTRQQGRGTYVTDHSSNAHLSRYWRIGRVDEARAAEDSKTIDIVQAPANAEECHRLRLQPSDEVFRVRGVCSNGTLPFMVEEASLPAAVFPGLLEKKGAPHRIATLAQEHGILLGKAEERISIRNAPASVAEALRIAPDTPVMRLDRIIRMLDDQPVEWRIAHCNLSGGYFYISEMT
jgi:GntR family transcriptional regulator